MARLQARMSVAPERIKAQFPGLKPTVYDDPAARKTPNNIRTLAWNPLGTWVATGCSDKTLRVWNVDKPNVRQSTDLKGHTASIEKVAFNPVKELELCSVSADGTARFWDVKTKALLNEVKGLGETFTLAWAPNGEHVVVGNKEDKLFVLSPAQSTPISEHAQAVPTNTVAFDWSGQRVFAATGDGTTRILSFPEFEPAYQFDYKEGSDAEFKLRGHTSSCTVAELHPYGRFLATGGTDSLISLWDTTEWNCHRTITKMVGPIRSISKSFLGNDRLEVATNGCYTGFSWDGLFVVGGSDEGNGLEISLSETGEHLCTYKTASPSPTVAWAPNRYALAYTDMGSLRIIGASAGSK